MGTGLAAIKLTALGRPQLLIQLSEVVVHTRKFFKEVTGADKAMALSTVTPSVIGEKLHISPSDREAFDQWLQRMDYDRKGLLLGMLSGDSACLQPDEHLFVEWSCGHQLLNL